MLRYEKMYAFELIRYKMKLSHHVGYRVLHRRRLASGACYLSDTQPNALPRTWHSLRARGRAGACRGRVGVDSEVFLTWGKFLWFENVSVESS